MPSLKQSAPGPVRPERGSRPWRVPTELWTLVALLAVFGLFLGLCLARGETAFVSPYNLKTIITHTVIVGIGALGMTLLIISGNMDLSAGSLIALTTVVTALVLKHGAGAWVPWLAALAGIAAAAVCATASGVITSRFRITPFIVTLGMMQIARGLAKWLAANQTVVPPKTWLNNLMVVDPGVADPRLAWLVVAPGVWLLLTLTLVVHVLLRVTVFGRHVFAVGSNPATARLCGVGVGRVTTLTFALGGMFAGMAGVMQFANLTVGDPTAAVGMELDIIAAVVIGGGSLSGGEGSAVGTVIGAVLMTILRNGCNMMGWENYVQNVIVGVVIIGAVAIDGIKHRLRG
jgi:ribose/xylose/arabinose/galactoside ABC-type transport system permease subunit